jgi:hypothetical protein
MRWGIADRWRNTMVMEARWRLFSASHGRVPALAAGLVVSLLAAGCATPIGVRRIRPEEANRQLTASVLTSGKPGAPAQEFLYRLNLSEKYREDPASTINELHAGLGQVDEPNRLFALAELSFDHAEHGGARSYFKLNPALAAQTAVHMPTAIDNMDGSHPFIKTLSSLPIAPGVEAHSIIAVKGDGPPEEGDDGVVKYTSAYIDGVASEFIVRDSHSTQATPATIEEVRRLLYAHLKEHRGCHARHARRG